MSVCNMTSINDARDKGQAGSLSLKKAPLDSLTSLRFFAVLAIVVYHLKPVMPAFFQPVRARICMTGWLAE